MLRGVKEAYGISLVSLLFLRLLLLFFFWKKGTGGVFSCATTTFTEKEALSMYSFISAPSSHFDYQRKLYAEHILLSIVIIK